MKRQLTVILKIDKMQKTYLIKRSPDFVKNGVIIKQNQKNKFFSESGVNMPSSNNLKIGDTIYVSETEYGIYAKGVVDEVYKPIKFNDTNEILNYFNDSGENDSKYWFKVLIKLHNNQKKNKNAFIWFHRYKVNLKLLSNIVSLSCKGLKKLKSRGGQPTILDLETIKNIETPIKNKNLKIQQKIPGELKYKIHSIFNQKLKVSTWIDIDHLVPKSIGGAGNIPENLIPIALEANRFKNNSIPHGLFKITSEQWNELNSIHPTPKWEIFKKKCEKIILEKKILYNNSKAKNLAREIISLVHDIKDIDEIKKFYIMILKHHYPNYVEIIKDLEY